MLVSLYQDFKIYHYINKMFISRVKMLILRQNHRNFALKPTLNRPNILPLSYLPVLEKCRSRT